MKMHLLLLAAMSFVITVPAYGKIDDASLKERLCHYFYADESIPWDEIDVIKERLGATDEQFHRALMEISREAEERMAVLEPKTAEWYKNRKMVAGVIGWLPKCKTVPVKDFLLNYAATKKNDPVVRVGAVFSYLRVADAEEAKGGLIRFLIEGDRMDSQARSTIIWSTLMVYQDAAAEKRKAIVESLQAALASEDTKWLFRVYDDILSQISPQYTRSVQRRAMLARLIRAPALCKADEYALPELEDKLRELKRANLYTTINTNLSVVKERDFNQPSSEDEQIVLEIPPDTSVSIDIAKEESPRTRWIGFYALGGAAAVILAAAGAWLFRKHGVSRP